MKESRQNWETRGKSVNLMMVKVMGGLIGGKFTQK